MAPAQRPVAFVADALLVLGGVAARACRRWCPRTGSAACFRNFVANFVLCHKGYLPVRAESQLDAPVRELPPYRVRDLMGANKKKCHQRRANVQVVVPGRGGAKLAGSLQPFDATEADDWRHPATLPACVFAVGPLTSFPASPKDLLQQTASPTGRTLQFRRVRLHRRHWRA
ncbi:hypothetical protein ZWY2020_058158 [Hordeum vulgare]|nr:hypothetical protein ZWY2020_058158 [Hordeum vulgare]